MAPVRHLSSYLQPGEQFHFAHIEISSSTSGDAGPDVHTQSYHELFWVERGTVHHHVNGQLQELSAGSLVFVRPFDAHTLVGVRGRALIANLAFPSDTLDFIAQRHSHTITGESFWWQGPLPSVRMLSAWERRAVTLWSNRLDGAGRTLLALDAFLLAVLGLLHGDNPLPAGADEGPDWLMIACRSLQKPDALRAGVKGFVAASGCAAAHVARVTRRHTGRSPSDLVAEARMKAAARLLVHSNMPIVEVAEEIGLGNLSYFYARFRQAYGTSPRRYRLANRGDPVMG